MSVNRKYLKSTTKYIKLWRRSLKLTWTTVPYLTTLWAVLLIIQGILPGITIYLTKLVIDSFAAVKNDNFSLKYSVVILILTGITLILVEVFQFLIDWIRAAQAEILTDYLKDLVHQKAIEVDFEFYESPEYFDLLEQAKSESLTKPLMLLENFGSVSQSAITLLTFSVLLLSYGWWVPLILLIGTLPALYIYFLADRLYHKWWKETAADRRWLMYFDTMISHSAAAAEMRIFDLNERFRNRFQSLRLRLRNERMRHLRRQYSGKLLASFLALFTAAVGVGWMAIQVFRGLGTIGDLAVFYQVFSRGQALMRALLGGVSQIFNNSLYLENLFEFLDLQPKIASPSDPIPFPEKIRYGIKFNNVSFRYPGAEKTVIENFSLFIPAGNIIAIVGVNGAGKSTLIKLLCRFYDPDQGSVEIDNIDIRNFDLAELRKNLSLCFQFPLQYHETAAQNIAFGDIKKLLEPKKIQTAAEQSGAHDFISELPKKYETLLGKWFADGCELSGGQWQRIALARAYYRQAQILILDEPTSFMDSWAEAEWFDNLRNLTVDRTGFVITHRFTIAMRADIIHVVHEGDIIESGSHEELLETDGFYAQSWKSQMQTAGSQQIETKYPNRFFEDKAAKLAAKD